MTEREFAVRSEVPLNPMPVDNAEYHSHTAVSKSHLDEIERSPLHYWSRYLDVNRIVPPPTPAMVIGTALHTHVLELSEWDKQFTIAPEGIDRRTKAGKEMWAAFEADANGKTVLSKTDGELIAAMGRSIYGHPAAAMLLAMSGKAETSHFWTDEKTGLECKCRPDWLFDDYSVIVDLKTTEDASPRGFQKSIAAWNYHKQAAWYLHGIEQATGVCPSQFIFIAVEKKPPYAVGVYAADAEMIKLGWEKAERNLERIAECRAAKHWPGYSEAIEPISVPPWMRPKADGSMPTVTEIQEF